MGEDPDGPGKPTWVGLVAVEISKLVSTRSMAAVLAAPIVYPALIAATARSNDGTPSDLDAIELLRGTGDVLPVMWLLVGALAVAGEFSDGSIVSRLIAVPDRVRLLGAELGALAVMAVLVTCGAVLSGFAAAAVAGPSSWLDGVSGPDLVRTIAALVFVAPVFAVVGGGIGVIVRQPTAAAVGILVWMLAAENAVPAALDYADATRWVSSRSAAAMIDAARPDPDAISALAGLGVLGAITAIVVAIGAVTFARRDVTG